MDLLHPLYFQPPDIVEKKRLIEEQPNSEYKKVAFEKLEKMTKFHLVQVCRHQVIATILMIPSILVAVTIWMVRKRVLISPLMR